MGNLMHCKAYAKSTAVQGGSIEIIASDRHYWLNAGNEGRLSFDNTNAGKISDSKLEEVWAKYASYDGHLSKPLD
jgi:hypothetical protein